MRYITSKYNKTIKRRWVFHLLRMSLENNCTWLQRSRYISFVKSRKGASAPSQIKERKGHPPNLLQHSAQAHRKIFIHIYKPLVFPEFLSHGVYKDLRSFQVSKHQRYLLCIFRPMQQKFAVTNHCNHSFQNTSDALKQLLTLSSKLLSLCKDMT